MERQGKKLAVLAGCNYKNTDYELRGCINDVVAMRQVLISHFGFNHDEIEFLTDEPESKMKPTGVNIKNALEKMIEKSQNGDILFFHFSGHGTFVQGSLSSILHPHRKESKDDAIVPCDFNLITDMDFRRLVNKLPKGATFTICSDSCHSGGLIAQEKEQIGPSTTMKTTPPNISLKPRFIPFETLLQKLASLSKIDSNDIGTHLLELFGSECSIKFQKIHERDDSTTDGGILLSGCQKNEGCADMAAAPDHGGKAYGAFTYAIQEILKEHCNKGPITNKELVKLARKFVKEEEKVDGQHPCLYCIDANVDANFLMPQS